MSFPKVKNKSVPNLLLWGTPEGNEKGLDMNPDTRA